MKSIYTYSAKQSKTAIMVVLAIFWAGSGHAKLDSVKKYADVGLERIRELMHTEPVQNEKMRMVK